MADLTGTRVNIDDSQAQIQILIELRVQSLLLVQLLGPAFLDDLQRMRKDELLNLSTLRGLGTVGGNAP